LSGNKGSPKTETFTKNISVFGEPLLPLKFVRGPEGCALWGLHMNGAVTMYVSSYYYMCPHAGDQYGRAGVLGAIFEKSMPPEPNLPNLNKTRIYLF
jgi:hypothetical protein